MSRKKIKTEPDVTIESVAMIPPTSINETSKLFNVQVTPINGDKDPLVVKVDKNGLYEIHEQGAVRTGDGELVVDKNGLEIVCENLPEL